MSISVFLSFPKPHMVSQQSFIDELGAYLVRRGFEPRTLGISDYDMDAPLVAIRRLMSVSFGFVGVGFRRAFAERLVQRKDANAGNATEVTVEAAWLTSSFVQIETAMAFQLGLPILIYRERGVLDEGILQRGVTGFYVPEFDSNRGWDQDKPEWAIPMNQWEGRVRSVYERRGHPPQL